MVDADIKKDGSVFAEPSFFMYIKAFLLCLKESSVFIRTVAEIKKAGCETICFLLCLRLYFYIK